MTREEIIRMAREAGFQVRNDTIRTMHSNGSWVGINEELERFAALVAAAEREACAKVCEDFAGGTSAYEAHHRFAAYKCADLIRKRGEDESVS